MRGGDGFCMLGTDIVPSDAHLPGDLSRRAHLTEVLFILWLLRSASAPAILVAEAWSLSSEIHNKDIEAVDLLPSLTQSCPKPH